MQYRPLDSNGDYTVGVPFLINSPACVGQAISTRLKLWMGEWFLDQTEGTPWSQSILGRSSNPDAYIKQRILGTIAVTAILTYTSTYTGSNRAFNVSGTVSTLYGNASFSATLNPVT
jgi:hypothetical protein